MTSLTAGSVMLLIALALVIVLIVRPHGNVWEWVQDWYGEQYYASSPSVDPKGPPSGSGHVVRGGSWHQTSTSWRSAFRKQYEPDYRGISIGFRLVLSTEP